MNLEQVKTKTLSEEMEKREGVNTIIVEPHEKIIITAGTNQTEVEGPAVILINQD